MWTRCSKCTNCLIHKRELWIARSFQEGLKWPKKWFVTLTYANVEDYQYANVQIWAKSIRNRRKAKGKTHRITYICTDEHDSSGKRDRNPHHHLVVYGGQDLTYRDIVDSTGPDIWRHGHSHAEILQSRTAAYVAKYITKTGTRIRASQDFGKHTTKHFNAKQATTVTRNRKSINGNVIKSRTRTQPRAYTVSRNTDDTTSTNADVTRGNNTPIKVTSNSANCVIFEGGTP